MRVLDLGCGRGCDLSGWGITGSDEIAAVDVDKDRLLVAKTHFPERRYLQGAGECLPFADKSFDRVIAAVALPYMNIPRALEEIGRVLVPGGGLSVSLHLPGFTFSELLHKAFPRPVPTLYRMYVIANGCLFHCTGWTVGFVNGRTESFQTPRGMRIALRRAGLVSESFTRGNGAAGETFIVEARKPDSRALDRTVAA
jgi:ubiquinone/menaquinone biosynthesis C-methylase UbiE